MVSNGRNRCRHLHRNLLRHLLCQELHAAWLSKGASWIIIQSSRNPWIRQSSIIHSASFIILIIIISIIINIIIIPHHHHHNHHHSSSSFTIHHSQFIINHHHHHHQHHHHQASSSSGISHHQSSSVIIHHYCWWFRNPSPVEVGLAVYLSLSQCLRRFFLHPRWCRIYSINSIIHHHLLFWKFILPETSETNSSHLRNGFLE